MAAQDKFSAEIAVIGGGPAGLTAAIALKAAGVDALLIAPAAEPDHRTTALLAGSVTALDTLGVWPLCAAEAAPIHQIRLIDDSGRLLRARETLFAAAEIGLEAFGFNIENRHLLAALETRATSLELPRLREVARSVRSDAAGVRIELANGEVRVRMTIAADGRRSLARAAAGIKLTRSAYPQTAVTLNLGHAHPHHGISTEFHTETGPFTLVPLPGCRSSVVCVVDHAGAARLAGMGDDELAFDIERRAHSLLGKMSVEPGRGLFPLSVETANTLARDRTALIGEAAHVVPPIGAQGLNLGLRDSACIAELLAEARRQNRDPGSSEVLERYRRQRRADVGTRVLAVDVLNRSLLADFLPAQALRGLSLYLLDRIGPLRRALMREGIAPFVAQPRLMRGEMI